MDRLLEIMRRLRDPERGCPWDRQQTYKTILPYTLEEAYEVADAIDREHYEDLREELGDLLFQVVFYAQIATEEGRFQFPDIVESICDKLERRHPHVFGDHNIPDAETQTRAWEQHKKQERANKSAPGNDVSLLQNIPTSLPAMARAMKLHRRAATVGFDWPDIHGVLDKLDEEVGELKHEIATDGDRERLQDEIGDLLFVTTILARHAAIDPESALRSANTKFERRFRGVEQELAQRGKNLQDASLQEMDAIWDHVKRHERKG